MTWSNLRFNVWRSFVTMATNLPFCFFIQFLEQLLKFLVNFTLLKYVKSQRSYGFLITKELIFSFQILDLKDHFSASLTVVQKCLACFFPTKFFMKHALPFTQSLNQITGSLSKWLGTSTTFPRVVRYVFSLHYNFTAPKEWSWETKWAPPQEEGMTGY